MTEWDVIVLGLGGVGSAATYQLAAAGLKVLGIDQYEPAHDRGSSHGRTRVIRQAYFEHPDYVPVLHRAYDLWQQLEQQTGRKLFERVGVVQMGPANGVVVPGVLRSAAEHQLDVESLSMNDVTARWPSINGPALSEPAQGNNDHWQAVVEPNAGFLHVEACVAAHLQMAQLSGAECRHGETVVGFKSDAAGITVTTKSGIERCQKLIVAAGAWSGELLRESGVPLQVLRKYQYWFTATGTQFDRSGGFPCFFFDTPTGYFYGFPKIDSHGVKVARHSGGMPLTKPLDDLYPDRKDVDPQDLQLVQQFNAIHLPNLHAAPLQTVGCYYTVTPDEHFIIDRLPDHLNVIVVAGLSGHGFKFTSALGAMAAEIATNQRDPNDMPIFCLARFQRV